MRTWVVLLFFATALVLTPRGLGSLFFRGGRPSLFFAGTLVLSRLECIALSPFSIGGPRRSEAGILVGL
ncbi:hypothetical protein F2Q69_00062756 [Brassica cretica]|uniref:Uncharacterized protein n=1 Tax=Brassica cretica TaxID=69181 RepID=A0A8S9RFM3_BRACR|nr:hypothetical protein F2Q69_00062756 [Brassica cretica]